MDNRTINLYEIKFCKMSGEYEPPQKMQVAKVNFAESVQFAYQAKNKLGFDWEIDYVKLLGEVLENE